MDMVICSSRVSEGCADTALAHPAPTRSLLQPPDPVPLLDPLYCPRTPAASIRPTTAAIGSVEPAWQEPCCPDLATDLGPGVILTLQPYKDVLFSNSEGTAQ